MNLPRFSPQWLPPLVLGVLGEWQRILEADAKTNLKRGQDLEMADGRFILTDTVTGDRVALSIANGVVTQTIL